MSERALATNRFTLDDPDLDLLDLDLPEDPELAEELHRSERWLVETANPNTLR